MHHHAQPRSACNARHWNTELVSVTPQAAEEQVGHEGEDSNIPLPSLPELQLEFGPDLGWEAWVTDPYNDPAEDRRSASPPIPAAVDSLRRVIDTFPGTSTVFEQGEMFLSWFDLDPYAVYQKRNLYYPFASLHKWKMANFLLTSRLSMSAIDRFLFLQMVHST